MSIIGLLITLMIIGLLLWLTNNKLPMEADIKRIINAVVVVCVVLWLLSMFGINLSTLPKVCP